jgi:hypothetical protein
LSEKESKVRSSRLYHELNILKYIQELKDAFFAEMEQNKPALIDDNPGESKVATTSTKGKGKPKLKKKTVDDPFASDNDDHEDDTDRTSKNPTDRKRSNDDEEAREAKSKKKRIA